MRTPWAVRTGIVAVAALSTLAGIVVPTASSSAAPRATRTMVVFFKHPTTSLGSVRERAADASILRTATLAGARVLRRASLLDAAVVRVTAGEALALAASPLVAAVLPNTLVPSAPDPMVPLRGGRVKGPPAHAPCGTRAKPELDPEALGNINAIGPTNAGYDGAGVTVAFIADGVDPTNADFQRSPAFASAGSPAGTPVITSVNFTGLPSSVPTAGGEAFGDASSIAAQGNTTFNLDPFIGPFHALPANCDIRIQGAAPGASVLALNIFGSSFYALGSIVVQAINYAVANGASVINESFGFTNFPDSSEDIVRLADEAAVAAGVTVVVSSGDAGPSSTISSPASDPSVLAVGATTQYRAYAQETFGGINALSPDAGYLDNNISAFSSGGIAQDGKTVNLVAPGDLGWAVCTHSPLYAQCAGHLIELFGGTSESAPLTAAGAADVIQAYRQTHAGVSPSPRLVMQILTSTTSDVDAPAFEQGAGLLNVGAAVQLATSIAGTTLSNPLGGVLSDTTQVNLEGLPSSTQVATIGLTNTSKASTTVNLATRAVEPSSTVTGMATLVVSPHSRSSFVDNQGFVNDFRVVSFSVPAGAARVQLQAAFATGGFNPFGIAVSLFAPNGDLAAYSIPQGFSNYADVEASAPQPGVWRAVFFEPVQFGGPRRVTEPVRWSATTSKFVTEGSITPSSVTLAPGQTRTVQLGITLPPTAGDTGLGVVMATGSQDTTIPVTLRTEVDLSANGGSFTGVLNGGNGRGGAAAQQNTYAFSVPEGQRDLDVGLILATNPAVRQSMFGPDELEAFLVDPDGDAQALGVNWTNKPNGGQTVSRFDDLYVADPMPGPWLLVLNWTQPVSGAATAVKFYGAIRLNAVAVSQHLPDAATTVVPKAGRTFRISVHNGGLAPLQLFPDARLPGIQSMPLRDLLRSGTRIGTDDEYYLPTGSQSLTVQQDSSLPATFQVSEAFGNPLLAPNVDGAFVTATTAPKQSSLTFSPPGGVTPGTWLVASTEIGPYLASDIPVGTATEQVHVMALAFDPGVSSTTTNLVFDYLRHGGFHKLPVGLVIAPGKTATIDVTIKPTVPTGTVVSGTLYLDNALVLELPTPLVGIPYQYVVGS